MDSTTLLPRLTIITVCLNAGKTLLRTLNSITSQTYPNIELILCDGGSKDDTAAIFKQWLQMSESKLARIHWVRQQSVGMYAAMNEAALQASGQVITFLHANDAFDHAQVCEIAMLGLKANSDIHAFYGDIKVLSEHWWKRRFISARWWRPWMLSWGFMSPQPGFFVKSMTFRTVGPFIETMRIGADFEWKCRFYHVCGYSAQWLKKIQVNMLSGGVSMRGMESRKIITNEIAQALRSHGYKVSTLKLWVRFPLKGYGILRAIWR